jgi:hypothetical protein
MKDPTHRIFCINNCNKTPFGQSDKQSGEFELKNFENKNLNLKKWIKSQNSYSKMEY